MKPAGSSWLGSLRAGGEGDSAMWENDVMFSVGGSPSLNQPWASAEPGDRERQGRRKKKRSKVFLSVLCCGPSVNTGAWALVPWKEEGWVFLLVPGCLPERCPEWLCPAGSFCWEPVCGWLSSCPLYFWDQQGECEAFLGYPLLSEGLGLEAHILQMKSWLIPFPPNFSWSHRLLPVFLTAVGHTSLIGVFRNC